MMVMEITTNNYQLLLGELELCKMLYRNYLFHNNSKYSKYYFPHFVLQKRNWGTQSNLPKVRK